MKSSEENTMLESSPEQSAPPETTKPEEQPLPKIAARKAKRPRGTGSIFKMGKYFYLAYYLPNGFQKTESSRSTLKTVAQEMLRDRLERIRHGLYCETSPRKVTFETLATDVVNDYRINRRRSIKDVEGRLRNHLRPYFGHHLAAGITTDLVKEYILLRRSEGATDGSIQLETVLLKRMFNLAYRATKVARVPYIPVPRSDNVRKGFIERGGYERLLAGLPEYLRPPVIMAYLTGMRRGEILSLRWGGVDLLNRQVRLNPGETKNGKGRVIPLGQELFDMLTSQLHLRNSLFPECPLVFFRIIKTKKNPVPSWVPIGDIRKAFEVGCAKAGLTGLLFHDLRRSSIRNMVRAGVQERVAMRLSGHLSRAVFDRYNIVSDQDLTEAVQKLQKFQDAAEPASQPPQTESRVSAVRPAFVN
jgi:integrase